jgi:hypothetical protein
VDPGFPRALLKQWHSQLQLRFTRESTQFAYAKLFGNLLTEWLASKEPSATSVEATDGFEKISRKETMEQQQKLESIIFEKKNIDIEGLKSYLDELFAGKEAKEGLKTLRKAMKECGESIRKTVLTLDDVRSCTKSLLASDLLSDEKQATLREFLQNDVVLNELVSVLNMQITSLSTWSWPESGVIVEPRRHLNGKVRFFLDYEILTAMLLHYVGMKWSVGLKSALKSFQGSSVWKDRTRPTSALAEARHHVFMGGVTAVPINALRRNFQNDEMFMSQLPGSMQAVDSYGEYDSDSDDSYGISGADLKQKLLHHMSADMLIKEAIHEECTVVKTDIEWFGPSMSHATVLTVLEYLGIPEADLDFFKAFLACPLQFQNTTQGSMDIEARVRVRGLPISHALTTLCAEAALFFVDFAVNQRADGLFLHRIHDDFWFWDNDANRCVNAWKEIGRAFDLLGLNVNKEKTGAVHIGTKGALHKDLPVGDITWGFLKMDPSKNGQFVIDRAQVDVHIEELKRQLEATTSVFAWVQAYNKYMAFFSRNFGNAVNVYGRQHVDNIIETYARIQKGIFADSGGSAIHKLSQMLSQKFGTSDIPWGWFYWPMQSGGLQLTDPMVGPLTLRKALPETTTKLLEDAKKSDEESYETCKRSWGLGSRQWYGGVKNTSLVPNDSRFFSLEEYNEYRESHSPHWAAAFNTMLAAPIPRNLEETPDIKAALQVLGEGIKAFGSETELPWGCLSAYWKWIISLHHEEMERKFGGLAIVEPSAIPVGMLGVFNSSRTRWEQ